MSVFARLKKAREEKKGFTLVELIVVLVILAILAAMLIPALLGWIDEARNKQYVLEARNVYMAAQAIADEAYAKNPAASTSWSTALNSAVNAELGSTGRLLELADITVTAIKATPLNTSDVKSAYTIKDLEIIYVHEGGSTGSDINVHATLSGDNGDWEIEAPTDLTTIP